VCALKLLHESIFRPLFLSSPTAHLYCALVQRECAILFSSRRKCKYARAPIWIMDVCVSEWVRGLHPRVRVRARRFALGSAGFVLFLVADFECEKNCAKVGRSHENAFGCSERRPFCARLNLHPLNKQQARICSAREANEIGSEMKSARFLWFQSPWIYILGTEKHNARLGNFWAALCKLSN
jgi:hypothetical protein